MLHALYTPMVRKLNRGEAPVVFTFGTLIAGLVILTGVGWRDLWTTDWLALEPLVWGTIVYLAVFASAATFVLLQFATLHLPSAKVMAYTYLIPSWVILWEIALGRPPPPFMVLIGVFLTVLSLILLIKSEEQSANGPVPLSD